MHHERLITFGKIIETSIKEFLEFFNKSHMEYQMSDCLINGLISFLSSLEDECNIYEKIAAAQIVAINKFETDKKLNKMQSSNHTSKLNELKLSNYSLIMSSWKQIRIYRSRMINISRNLQHSLDCSSFLSNIFHHFTMFNIIPTDFESFKNHSLHFQTFFQFISEFQLVSTTLNEIPKEIAYSSQYNKILTNINNKSILIKEKTTRELSAFNSNENISMKYGEISVKLQKISDWFTSNSVDSFTVNFMMDEKDLLVTKNKILTFKTLLNDQQVSLISIKDDLIGITLNNHYNLYNNDELINKFYNLQLILNNFMQKCHIILFLLQINHSIYDKILEFKSRTSIFQKKTTYFIKLFNENTNFFLNTDIMTDFYNFSITGYIDLLQFIKNFNVVFNCSIYFSVDQLNLILYEFINQLRSVYVCLIETLVASRKNRLCSIKKEQVESLSLKYIQTMLVCCGISLKTTSINPSIQNILYKHMIEMIGCFIDNNIFISEQSLITINQLKDSLSIYDNFINSNSLLSTYHIVTKQSQLLNNYLNSLLNHSDYMKFSGHLDSKHQQLNHWITSSENFREFIQSKQVVCEKQMGNMCLFLKKPIQSIQTSKFYCSKMALFANIQSYLSNFKCLTDIFLIFHEEQSKSVSTLSGWLKEIDESMKKLQQLNPENVLTSVNQIRLDLFKAHNQTSLIHLTAGSYYTSLFNEKFKELAKKYKYSRVQHLFKSSFLNYPIFYYYNKLIRINNCLNKLQIKFVSIKATNDEQQMVASFKWEDFRAAAQIIVDNDMARLFSYWRFHSLIDKKANLEEFCEILQSISLKVNNLVLEQIFQWINRDSLVDIDDFIDVIKRCVNVKQPSLKNNEDLPDNLKIESAIDRAIRSCTCDIKFEIIKVADCRYKFGSSFQIRLVRILSNSVMVRVGGGWEELMKFLSKVDPCKCGVQSSSIRIKPSQQQLTNVQNSLLTNTVESVKSINSSLRNSASIKSSAVKPLTILNDTNTATTPINNTSRTSLPSSLPTTTPTNKTIEAKKSFSQKTSSTKK